MAVRCYVAYDLDLDCAAVLMLQMWDPAAIVCNVSSEHLCGQAM